MFGPLLAYFLASIILKNSETVTKSNEMQNRCLEQGGYIVLFSGASSVKGDNWLKPSISIGSILVDLAREPLLKALGKGKGCNII